MPQSPQINPSDSTRFILVGEDDFDDQELLKEVFTAADGDTRLLFVNNGKEVFSALEELTDNQLPHLIVLDFNMPGLSGADILKELNNNSRYSHIPKVIWSTSQSDKYRELCLQLGARDYVVKPSSVKEFESVVRYMLSVCAN